MLKLKDVLEILKGDVAISLRDYRGDLVVTEPIPADELYSRLMRTSMRFFDYHILEMYSKVFYDGNDEIPIIQIILVR